MTYNTNATDPKFIAERITQLRHQRNPVPSERDISISIGRNSSYITKITAGNNMPLMDGLYAICEYFGVSAAEFFDPNDELTKYRKTMDKLKQAFGDDVDFMVDIITSIDTQKLKVILEVTKEIHNKLSNHAVL